jgi:hypothetical protein
LLVLGFAGAVCLGSGFAITAAVLAALAALQLVAATRLKDLARAGLDGELSGDGWRWAPFLGHTVVLAAFTILEVRNPRYFLQNDNLIQFGPVIIFGGRSLSHGIFPMWNPYQLCGAPIADVGTYALTYPLTYASYFIARGVLGDETSTIEVFAFVHLVLGYWATYVAARGVGVSRGVATLAALSVVLSGYNVIAGHWWFYMLPVPLWSALLAHSVSVLERRDVGFGWTCWTGSVIGAFFHAGNAQMWVYAVAFTCLALGILVSTGRVAWRKALWFLPALGLGLALAAPLLVPQFTLVSRLDRPRGAWGATIVPGLFSMICPTTTGDIPILGQVSIGHVYYSGTLFLIASVAGLVAMSVHGNRERLGRNAWILPCALAFLLALGEAGTLWSLQAMLPVFSKFSNPIKFLAFVNLYAAIGGAPFLDRWLREMARPAERLARATLASALVSLLLGIAVASPESFPSPFLDNDYSAAADLDRFRGPARLANLSNWNHERGAMAPVPYNTATLHEVLALTGYDPIVAVTPENRRLVERFARDPRGAARAYGVRWITSPPTRPSFMSPGDQDGPMFDRTGLRHATVDLISTCDILLLPKLALMRAPPPDPLAFFEVDPTAALPVAFDGHGARVDLPPANPGGPLIVNLILRPAFRATVDGHPCDVEEDVWGRARLMVPAGARSVDLSYEPPFRKGLLLGAGLGLAALGSALVLRRRGL